MNRWVCLLATVLAASSCGAPPAAAPTRNTAIRAPGPQPSVVEERPAGTEPPAPPTSITAATEPAEPSTPPTTSTHGVVYATGRIAWVYEKPNGESRKLGYLSVGVPVALRSPGRSSPSTKCAGGFYAVEPVGYVCANQNTTSDPDHPVVAAMREAKRSGDRAYPFRYGLSLGAPMYNKLPDRRAHELVMMRYPNMGKRLGDWAKSFLDMDAGEPIMPDGEVPSFLAGGKAGPNATQGLVRRSIPHASLLSYSMAFEHDGRVWLLAEDLSVVPADRVVPYRRTSFRGVELGGDVRLPIAWACRNERRKLSLEGEGELAPSGASWAPRELIRLSGKTMQVGRARYVESIDGAWIAASNVCEAKQAEKLPEGIAADGRWLYLSMMENTLVAYEGLQPVFATLHSPGRGGTHRGKGDVRQYTTPLGAFFINWKERWATLSPDSGAPTSFWISDVPGVQYFEQPYALHGAYWHESFGSPMSAGCPNLAPLDAVWLMDFTEPALPAGWQAIGPFRGQSGTMVVVGP